MLFDFPNTLCTFNAVAVPSSFLAFHRASSDRFDQKMSAYKSFDSNTVTGTELRSSAFRQFWPYASKKIDVTPPPITG